MDELLFSVEGNKASPATPISLAEAGPREREDLQQWVLAHPEILGSGVVPISFEFDQWRNAAGDRERDRLDVIAAVVLPQRASNRPATRTAVRSLMESTLAPFARARGPHVRAHPWGAR